MHSTAARIEITQPKLFNTGAVMAVTAYGLLLCAPVFMSMLVVSVIKYGILTVLIPLLVLVATAYFLPYGLGNTHVTRLVQSLNPAAGKSDDGFIVQITFSPRIRSGLRAILEDADDIGYLSFSGTEMLYQGDSVKLSVPVDRIQQVQTQNIGLRGLFVYGRRIRVVISGLPQMESVEFAERSSWLLPASRAITRRLYERLSSKVPTREGKEPQPS
jgi:hypothetical protein